MLVAVLSVFAAVLVAVRFRAAMQRIVRVTSAVLVLVSMSVLMGMGVAMGMRMRQAFMCVLVGMDMGMRMFVLMLMRMAMGLVMRMIVIVAVHVISPVSACRDGTISPASPANLAGGGFCEPLQVEG